MVEREQTHHATADHGDITITWSREAEAVCRQPGAWDPRWVGRVPACVLAVDQTVQRTLKTIVVNRIISSGWDWSAAELPTVALRENGTLAVSSGQHRVTAWRKIHPCGPLLVCRMPGTLNRNEEARNGLAASVGSSHDAVEKWRLAAEAGDDPYVRAAEEVLRKWDVRVTRDKGRHSLTGAGKLSLLIHGRKESSPEDGAELLDNTLLAISSAWPDSFLAGVHSHLFAAIGAVLSRGADLGRLVSTLQGRMPGAWTTGNQGKTMVQDGVVMEIARAYNKGRGVNRIRVTLDEED